MSDRNDRDERAGAGRHVDPANAATDPRAAAQQEQVKADHAALEESTRRVEASVGNSGADTTRREPATDPQAAEKQEQMKADHDELAASARRVESSVSPDVRNTPIQHTDHRSSPASPAASGAEDAHRNAEIARESARRVEESVEDRDKPRRPS